MNCTFKILYDLISNFLSNKSINIATQPDAENIQKIISFFTESREPVNIFINLLATLKSVPAIRT